MELDYILKLCWAIIVIVFTLMLIIAFVETIIKKIQAPKKEKEINDAINKFADELAKSIEKELSEEDKPAKKRAKSSKKAATKEE